jgi:hypothetical protein
MKIGNYIEREKVVHTILKRIKWLAKLEEVSDHDIKEKVDFTIRDLHSLMRSMDLLRGINVKVDTKNNAEG